MLSSPPSPLVRIFIARDAIDSQGSPKQPTKD